MSILLDAGPALNFLAVRQENILIQLAASRGLQLLVPRRVDIEVEGKADAPRFKATPAARTWGTLKAASRVVVVDDALSTQQFADAVARVSGMPAQTRVKDKASLGEIMVIAHASVFAQRGEQVYVLMDESDGRRRATKEREWLQVRGAAGRLDLWSTPQVLQAAAQEPGWISGGRAWTSVYDQMRKFDDGLLPRPRR